MKLASWIIYLLSLIANVGPLVFEAFPSMGQPATGILTLAIAIAAYSINYAQTPPSSVTSSERSRWVRALLP